MDDQDELVEAWVLWIDKWSDMSVPEIFQYYECLNVFTIPGGVVTGEVETKKEYDIRKDWCRANLRDEDLRIWSVHGIDRSHVITAFRNRSDVIRFRLIWGGETVELEPYR